MNCEECRRELEQGLLSCPSCGAQVPRVEEVVSAVAARRDPSDWREQVRETVARHKEKKRREQERRDDDARQLSIFPDEAQEDEEGVRIRQRRAEIRARVEERVARQQVSHTPSRRMDPGEIAIRRGRAGAATARELSHEPEDDALDRNAVAMASLADPADEKELDFVLGADGPEGAEGAEGMETAEPFHGLGVASAFDRVFSGLIDLAFVALIQLTLFYLTTHLVSQRLGALPQSALVAMGLVGTVLAAGYFLFFWGLSGQTLGKLLTGARVVDRQGSALGFGRAGLRLLALLVAILPLGAGFIGLWTDPERRGWHDRIAGTKVVRG